MNERLAFVGLVKIPPSIILSFTPYGVPGALAYAGGTVCGALTIPYLARSFFVRFLQYSPGPLAGFALSLPSIVGGWAAVNLAGYSFSFKGALLTQLGGIMLIGSVFTLLIIAIEIKNAVKTCWDWLNRSA